MFVAVLALGWAVPGAVSPAHAPIYRLHASQRPALLMVMQPEKETPPTGPVLESVLANVMKVAETASEAAGSAANNWINSGWQVKKRAGQVLPEIRPNAASLGDRAALLLPSPAEGESAENGEAMDTTARATPSENGAMINVPANAASLLQQGTADLEDEFISFLSVSEADGAFATTEKGEILFRSRESLVSLVSTFTAQKLGEFAVAAKALARYVSDLELELESADEAVVELRSELQSGQSKQKESEKRLMDVEIERAQMQRELTELEQEARARAQAQSYSERAAEEAAEELLQLQASLEELKSANLAKAAAVEVAEADRALLESAADEAADRQRQAFDQLEKKQQMRVVKLEEKLMWAEQEAMRGDEATARMRELEQRLMDQEAMAAAELEAANLQLQTLAAKAEEAEAEAERTSRQLSEKILESEQTAAELRRLDEIERMAAQAADETPPPPAPPASAESTSSGVTWSGGWPTTGSPTRQTCQYPSGYGSETERESERTAVATSTPDRVDAQQAAQELLKELNKLEAPNVRTADKEAPQDAAGAAAKQAAELIPGQERLAALSRMKKGELVAECEARGLEASGSTAELRAKLRVSRKRDNLVQELEERGWSASRARKALVESNWDTEAAIAYLAR